MKETELMIGDWVLHNTYPERIKLIGNTMVKVYTCDNTIDIDELCPIPLTAEILEKNYPDRRHCVYWYWHDKISTDTENWYELHIEVGTDEGVVRNIRYVHELQHALRLCGIEKEVVL